ncbi:16118_t:CDS:2 [Racocetra fulgida]|uniref:16118_t:CDS:1 n=1 Tax=Racocetra fulgida TaxID=60492 RepID=A0A9N8WGQ7_9GLOM|nr:16118_t:CDS:2 [Racocetra fulgida]
MSILCKYDPKGHYANVADATKRQPIISVTSELVMMKRSTYPNQGNSKTSDDKSIKDRKSRNEELEKLVEKFSPPPNKKQPRNVTKNINEDPQEESFSRAKRLKSAINQVNEIKVQYNAEVQHNAVNLTRSDENSAEHLYTTVEMDTNRLYLDEEQPNNLDDEDTP